jgi:hypothetical protein
MNNSDLRNKLASYLHDRDSLSLSEVSSVFNQSSAVGSMLCDFITSGDLEVRDDGLLEWQGTSSKPTLHDVKEQLVNLDANLEDLEAPPSKESVKLREYLVLGLSQFSDRP